MENKVNNYYNYTLRKKKELKLLGVSKIKKEYDNSEDVFNIINNKLKYQANLKAAFIKDTYNYQNTGRNSQELVFDGFKCSYEYQRYDIKIKQKNFLNLFYNLNDINYDYVFTNCGMSALFSTFYTLNKLSYKVYYASNIYVETERLIDDYIQRNEFKFEKYALFIDTVSFSYLLNVLEELDLDMYSIFVIDTTLYLAEELLPILKKLKLFNKPIILIKSHTKLDMLGIEWSKLGSVCLLCDNAEFQKKFFDELKIILSFIGGYAYCEDIPLFLSNLNYKSISYERNKIIKENTRYIYNKFMDSPSKYYDIIKPYHDLFLLIKPKKFIGYKQLEKDLHKFARKKDLKNLIYYADSFGLDCFGISGYYENMSADTEVIRISPSDYPIEICNFIIDEIIKWLDVYLSDKDVGEHL